MDGSGFFSVFHPADPERSRFLSTVFALFQDEIVHCWATDSRAPYRCTDRPTLRQTGARRGHTLDFAFQEPRRGQTFAVMIQCDPATDTPLTDEAQVTQLSSTRAFAAFLDAAQNPAQYRLIISGEEQPVAGSILIWSAMDIRKARAIRKTLGLQDIFAMDYMIRDLIQWQNRDFQMLLDRRAAWCYDFFRHLRRLP